jgi:hypothetical protein
MKIKTTDKLKEMMMVYYLTAKNARNNNGKIA